MFRPWVKSKTASDSTLSAPRSTEYAAVEGLELVECVTETASGGVLANEETSLEHRPILGSLIERARAKEYDVLLVARLDRLSRDYPSLAILERRLQALGVAVVSASESNGDGWMAEFIRGQLAQIAQVERAIIKDRLAGGKVAAKKQGRNVHGRIPFGYRVEKGQRGILVPDVQLREGATGATVRDFEGPAVVVRRIFTDRAAGYSTVQIAKRLNADAAPSPSGKPWSPTAVWRVLGNEPTYRGVRNDVRGAHPGHPRAGLRGGCEEEHAARRWRSVSSSTPMDVTGWVEAWRRSWEERDAEAAAVLFTEDVEYRTHAFLEPNRGPDGVRAYREGVTATQRNVTVRMGLPVVDGERVTVEFWTTLLNDGVPTTIAGCLLLRFAPDRRCDRFREYWFLEPGLRTPHDGWGE